jgi:hypothetical protein
MSRKHFLLTLVLALATSVAGHALYGALVSPQVAQARVAPRDSSDSSWEYCAVVKAQFPGSVRLVYWIAYFRDDGVRTENVEAELGGSAFAKAVAKLGQNGWEMVGEGPLEIRPGAPSGTTTAVFFKRHRD